MGRVGEAIETLEKALDTATDSQKRPAILFSLGMAYRQTGHFEDARKVLLQGVEEAKAHGRAVDQAAIFTALGDVENSLREWAQAAEHYEQALALYRKTNNRLGLAIIQSNLSWVYLHCGELQRALTLGDKSLRQMKALGDEFQISTLQHTLGLIHSRLGDWEEAVQLFQECYQTREHLGRLPDCVNPLKDMGSLYLDQGAFAEAAKSFERGLSFAGESGAGSLLLSAQKARALLGMGKLAEAEELASQTLARAKELGEEEALAFCERSWGQVLQRKGSLQDSRKALLSSADRFRTFRDSYEAARTLLYAAQVGLELDPEVLSMKRPVSSPRPVRPSRGLAPAGTLSGLGPLSTAC
jgi:tetratricopeptide (TPR) repeat protein